MSARSERTTSRTDVSRIAREVYQVVVQGVGADEYSVFLGGAALGKTGQLRDSLRTALSRRRWGNAIEVYYPEDIFEDILWKPDAPNLLGLENFLAEWVHAVVLIIEGYGAICELGAFANHPQLRNKMVILINEDYKGKRSFIMRGPVRFLDEETDSHVFYYRAGEEIAPGPILRFPLFLEVWSSIRKIAREQHVTRDLRNPIVTQLFLLTAIYCGEGLAEKSLIAMLAEVAGDVMTTDEVELTLQSALGALLVRREIAFADNRYLPTEEGYGRVHRAVALRKKQRTQLLDDMDRIRSEMIIASRG